MLYSQNLTQNIFQTGGRAPGAPVLDPPLETYDYIYNL